ncbi:MAG TPA: peptide-methionine (S)-S-oxide reductase MsrA [Desulfuromonadales bacterium]|jgi:peptide-methionine (S)-S-oxide reductase
MAERLETATLAAGCFWCVEAVFGRLRGVEKVVSGYAGGTVPNPTYQEVCSGTTGHAEAVQIIFDPATISFDELLEVFWRTHDPTTLNRQGADSGTQYRSAIFHHDERQRQVAERSKRDADAAGLWPDPIVTEIVPFTRFYPAEGYHQDYYRLNSFQPYCRLVIDPKIAKLQKEFADKLKTPAS